MWRQSRQQRPGWRYLAGGGAVLGSAVLVIVPVVLLRRGSAGCGLIDRSQLWRAAGVGAFLRSARSSQALARSGEHQMLLESSIRSGRITGNMNT